MFCKVLQLILICFLSTYAFGIDLTSCLGLNLSTFVGSDVVQNKIKPKLGADFIIGPDFIFSRFFSLNPEFGLHSKGANSNADQNYFAASQHCLSFNYYSISIFPTLRIPIADKATIFLKSGPSFNFLSSVRLKDADGETVLDSKDGLNPYDLTLNFRAGVVIPIRRFLITSAIDFNRGFTSSPLANPEYIFYTYPRIYNQSVVLYIGAGIYNYEV